MLRDLLYLEFSGALLGIENVDRFIWIIICEGLTGLFVRLLHRPLHARYTRTEVNRFQFLLFYFWLDGVGDEVSIKVEVNWAPRRGWISLDHIDIRMVLVVCKSFPLRHINRDIGAVSKLLELGSV